MSDLFASGPRQLHPAWIVYSAIHSLRALIVPIAITIISGRREVFELFGIGIALIITLIVVAVRAAIWRRFSYRVTGDGIRVHSGLISRHERFLPIDRIQSVDFHEGVLHRLLGVIAVRIESAAGAGTGADITLEALARADAERIREHLLGRRAVTPGEPAEARVAVPDRPTEGELLAAVPLRRLLAAGATSGRVGPALGLVFGVLQVIDDVLPERSEDLVMDVIPEPTLRGIAVIIALCAVLAWLFAVASTVLTFGKFELRLAGNRLEASYGLLERRRASMPLARIQAITISEGLLRQPFGLAAIRAESAGYGKETAESGVLLPIVARREIPAVLRRIVPEYAVDLDALELNGPPARAKRRYIIRPLLVPLTLTLIVLAMVAADEAFDAVDMGLSWRWALPGALATIAAAGVGRLRFRDDGWLVGEDGRVIIRTRPLHRVTVVTSRRRIQHRSLTDSPVQRRARLASLSVAIASGGGGLTRIAHLDRDDAIDLLRRLGRTAREATSAPLDTPRC